MQVGSTAPNLFKPLLHILYFPLNLVGKDERIHNLRWASVDTGKGLIGPPYLNKG